MSKTAMFVKIDSGRIVEDLQEVQSTLNSPGDAVLDFSGVSRVQPSDLAAMEELLKIADHRGAKIELRGVNVGIYKVLKLAKIASRFAFRT